MTLLSQAHPEAVLVPKQPLPPAPTNPQEAAALIKSHPFLCYGFATQYEETIAKAMKREAANSRIYASTSATGRTARAGLRRELILSACDNWIRSRDIADLIGMDIETVSSDLGTLKTYGKVIMKTKDREFYYRKHIPSAREPMPKDAGMSRKVQERLDVLVNYCTEWRSNADIKAELNLSKGQWERLRTIAFRDNLIEKKGTGMETRFKVKESDK